MIENTGQCQIAVTDDDSSIRKILDIMLRKAGHLTRIFTNAEDLLHSLQKADTPLDIIIMDIRMPGISGLEALPRIRETAPDIPVIMLTAFNSRDTGISAMRQGAFDYLSKPVHRKDLLETVDRACAYRRQLLEQEESASAGKEHQLYSAEQLAEEKKRFDAVSLSIMQKAARIILDYTDSIEQKYFYSEGHAKRVRDTALKLASFFGMTERELQFLEFGALLHDIGMTCIPESIFIKSGLLDAEETEIMQSHPLIGEKILNGHAFFSPCLPIVRSHHERFDGTGYPDGLSGEHIPLAARIVTIADAFDAMMSERPYRQAYPLQEALSVIERNSGSQFDPRIADVFLRHSVYDAYSE